jgi:ArsR family transcriptional regulator
MKTKASKCAGLPEPAELARLAAVPRLLAHPERLRIVGRLERGGAAPVHELMADLDLVQGALSQHLNHMKRAGLLQAERRGKEVWYSVADRRAVKVLHCMCCKQPVAR